MTIRLIGETQAGAQAKVDALRDTTVSLDGDNIVTDGGTNNTQDSNKRNQGKEFLRLPFDSGIRGQSRDGSLNFSMLRVADVPNIDGGTGDFMMIGDSRMDWISCNANLDMIGLQIIDVKEVGNYFGDGYNTRLVQGRDPAQDGADEHYVGIASRSDVTGAGLIDRLVVTNGKSAANSFVRISNANLVIGGSGITSSIADGSVGVVGINEATTPPASSPASGGLMWVQNGALKYRGSHADREFYLEAYSATKTPLVLKGAASQSALLFSIVNSSDSGMFTVTSTGTGTFANRVRGVDAADASSPTFSFATDTNTGMWRQAADNLGFAIGGNEGARLSAPADGETALLIRRNVGGTFALERVSMGATDSGGSGFKLLRVAN